MVIAVAQQPGFADGAIAGQRRGEQIGQTSATPEPILIDRFESQWIQRYFIHGISIFTLPHTGKCNSWTRRNEWGEHPIKLKPAKFRGAPAKQFSLASPNEERAGARNRIQP
jgi:hypothetical protein